MLDAMSTPAPATAVTPRTAPTPDVALARRQAICDVVHRSAARFGNRVALVGDAEEHVTYAELDEQASRLANGLLARGVEPGDHVALLSRNSLDYVRVIVGVARAGAVLVPVNFMLGAREVAYVLGHAGVTALFAETPLIPVAQEAVALAEVELRGRFAIGEDADGWSHLSELLSHATTTDPGVAMAVDAPAQVLYTSGTESRPKGAVLSHDALLAQYASCAIDGEMTGDDVEVHALPLFHCAQQHCFLLPGLMLGARNVVLPGPDPALLLAALEEHRATKLFCPPTVWISLLRHPDFDRRDLSALRKGYYGAAIMPVEVLHELQERLPDVRLWNFYGQTELAPLAVVLRPEDQLRKAGSAGRAALHVTTRVVDPDGHDVAVGEAGEVVHRTPHAMLGYLDDPERTEEAFRDGWFHSGDLGVLDDDGYLTVVDRIKDMIKTGGENVASREVEETIYAHPDVAEVAVVGLEHPTWIEVVVALVVLRDGASVTGEELRAHARSQLAGFKAPKVVRIVDALPKNPSGKVLKRELRATWQGLAEEA